MALAGPPRRYEDEVPLKGYFHTRLFSHQAIFTPVAHRSTSDHHVMKMRCYQGYFHASSYPGFLHSSGPLPHAPPDRGRGFLPIIPLGINAFSPAVLSRLGRGYVPAVSRV